MSMTSAVMTPADILKIQNEFVRTGNFEPVGRMQKIAIGANAKYIAPENDPIIARNGRFIELRDRPLPIGQSRDRSLLLICSPLIDRSTGYVALPDLPDPNWIPPPPTKEEVEGVQVYDVNAKRMVTKFPESTARQARMIPQRLEDRAEGILENTNFLIFSPVIGISFQPEINSRMIGDAWLIECRHDAATRTDMALLIDRQTGEAHFYGGAYEILGSSPNVARSPRG